MMKRNAFAILLGLVIVLSSFSISAGAEVGVTAEQTEILNDINDHWAADAIYKWSIRGIINGYQGLFRPNDSITKGEMAVILDNMMEYQITGKNTFTDLKADQFYTDAVLKVNAAGIIKGDGTSVRPTDKITREEAAVIMARAFAVKATTNETATFNDAATISPWAKGYVTAMEAKGYIKGSNNNFLPKNNVTRAEIVKIVDNIVKEYYTKSGTYTENINGTAVVKVTDVTLKGVTVSGNLIIAEGVGQGDVTLDSVTVKGETVVRGGGENSIHINGDSDITSLRIEKVDDKMRIVIADGNTVKEIIVDKGVEIIITGNVGTVNINAPNTKIIVKDANIQNINISGTAINTTIQTEKGSVVRTVTAAAGTTIIGQGSVIRADLNKGANNSSITTPKTLIVVGEGVTGVTGGGGKPIPAGSTGTNNATGSDVIISEAATGGGGGIGGGTVPPTIEINPINSLVVIGINEELDIKKNLNISTSDVSLSFSTEDEEIGSIEQNGEFIGKGQGKATIKAIASKTGYNSKTIVFDVVVAPVYLDWIAPSGVKYKDEKETIAIDITLLEGVNEINDVDVIMLWEKKSNLEWIPIKEEDITVSVNMEDLLINDDGFYRLAENITIDGDINITSIVTFHQVGEYRLTILSIRGQ